MIGACDCCGVLVTLRGFVVYVYLLTIVGFSVGFTGLCFALNWWLQFGFGVARGWCCCF